MVQGVRRDPAMGHLLVVPLGNVSLGVWISMTTGDWRKVNGVLRPVIYWIYTVVVRPIVTYAATAQSQTQSKPGRT
jgi:hypothetical protein